MRRKSCNVILLAAMVAMVCCGALRATTLDTKASAGTSDGLLTDTQPADNKIQTKAAPVSSAVTSRLDTICWRDTGLQVHCEQGTSPSGTSIETLSQGSALGDAMSEAMPSSDPAHPNYDHVILRAKASASITPSHTNIAKAAGISRATYFAELTFVRTLDCAQSVKKVAIVVRGRSTLDQSGTTHFACVPGFCSFDDPKATASIVIGAPWLTSGSGGSLVTSYDGNFSKVMGYGVGPGTRNFIASTSSVKDVFAPGPDGLRLEVGLDATAVVKGDSVEDPRFNIEAEATILGFLLFSENGEKLELPENAVTITDDFGVYYRVLSFSEVPELYPGDSVAPLEPCGDVIEPPPTVDDGSDDDGTDDTQNGSDATGDSENGCVRSLCGPSCAQILSLTSLALCTLRFRRRSNYL